MNIIISTCHFAWRWGGSHEGSAGARDLVFAREDLG